MTNYNDGKWHGWNGGECPVHPESVVKCAYTDRNSITDMAKIFPWSGGLFSDGSTDRPAAFRVVKEHRPPRRCWTLGPHKFDTSDEAMNFRDGVTKGYINCHNEPITEWVEVLK